MENPKKEKKMLTLKSYDHQEFLVEEIVAIQSLTIKSLLEVHVGDDFPVIPVPNVDGKTLGQVIEYLKMHPTKKVDDDVDEKKKGLEVDVKKFDSEFLNNDINNSFDLILAANFLNIPGLLELTSQKIADEIKNKSVEEVRKIFQIQNDYTAEEEAEFRKEHAWAFGDKDSTV